MITKIISHIGTKCINLSADVFDMLSQSIQSLFNKGLKNLLKFIIYYSGKQN